MAWRRNAGRLPAPLREFREHEWPPQPGECLGHYTCRGNGYDGDCVPRPGESCGQACYEMLARDCGTEALASARTADAFTRYHQARVSWLGPGTPEGVEEFCEGDMSHAIRYAHVRGAGTAGGP